MDTTETQSEKHAIWSPSQRRAIIILLLGLLVWLGWQAYRNRTIIEYPQIGSGARAEELNERIDPNTATASELAALPVIGPKVARQIVEYRERYHANDRSGEAFKNADDLLKVAGIGANTLEQIKPYLKFPVARAAGVHPRLK